MVLSAPRASLVRLLLRGRGVRLRRVMALYELTNIKLDLPGYDVYIETQANIPAKGFDISYVHFPAVAPTGKPSLYERLALHYASLAEGRPLVLTNGEWTRRVLQKYYPNITSIMVLYPPVGDDVFKLRGDAKDYSMVLTVSRFTPGKRLDEVARAACAAKDLRFYIVGSTSSYSAGTLAAVLRYARECGNIVVETNVPRKRLLELYERAGFYLHPPLAEHFGIAIAEAAAAGAVPVVYADGGGYYDIAAKVSPRLGYRSVEEAIKIMRGLREERVTEDLSARARKVASSFSFSAFMWGLKALLGMANEGPPPSA
ncbi:glycosyltransferase [Acidilobus sp.]|uniref:glycosyltransferase n=1 Tax=Acidilobus sp. TaxID=1872109 RepID=UPI003D050948